VEVDRMDRYGSVVGEGYILTYSPTLCRDLKKILIPRGKKKKEKICN
jgi:hypothetical protein